MKPLNEHDEFLLSRLLDNDLSPAEAEGLRRRIEHEPGLSEAYAAMTRLDGLLKGRRADQPQVDWKAFHARVTNQVERAAETRVASPIIRLSRWLAVGLPLAAAASIALVLMLHTPAEKPTSGGKGHGGPVGPRPGSLVIAVQRPETAPPTSPGPIQVNFKRSQQLLEMTKWDDAAKDEKPPVKLAGGPSLAPEAAPMEVEMDSLVDFLPM